MKLTQEADYAIRIVVYLAQTGSKRSAGQIYEQVSVTPRFTLKILRKLIRAGITRSYKGVNGGYELSRLPKDITLLDIVETIDGEVSINRCITCEDTCTRENHPEQCKTHSVLKQINHTLRKELAGVGIDRLI